MNDGLLLNARVIDTPEVYQQGSFPRITADEMKHRVGLRVGPQHDQAPGNGVNGGLLLYAGVVHTPGVCQQGSFPHRANEYTKPKQ